MLVNGQHVDTPLLVNTGIVTAYSIKHAMKAIEESQKPPSPPKGLPPGTVSELLGHSTLGMTRRYANLVKADLQGSKSG